MPNDTSSESSRVDVSKADLFDTDTIPTAGMSTMENRPRTLTNLFPLNWSHMFTSIGTHLQTYFIQQQVSIDTLVVVVFTLNRSFYPTTSAVPPVSFLILHPRDTNFRSLTRVTKSYLLALETTEFCGQTETEKNQTLKNQGRQIKCQRTGHESTAKKNATREVRATKKKILDE